MRWLLGAIVLLVIGIVLQLGLLVYAMYVLLGVMLVSRFLAREWIENITVERECSRTSVQIGEKAAVVVTIQNAGRLPVVWLLVEDSVPKQALLQRPPRIALEGKRVAIVQLPARGQKQLLYQVRFLMRGYYQIGPLLVESGDLFGLHRRFQIKTKPHYVLVYPKVLPLTGYDLASRRPIGEVRLTHRLFEDPTRISGVRPYQQGDALNRIHWRATARTGELHCKMYEPSCIAGVTLLLDFHQASYPARGEPHRSELAVTGAASLANAIYQMGQQFGLITNGRDAADRIREEGFRHEFRTRATALGTVEMRGHSDRLNPVIVETRRGPEQLTRILETLARVELSDGLTFSQLVIEATSRLPRDATVVALLADVPPETAIALGSLKRRGYAITALLVMADEDDASNCMGRLLAEGIEVRRIENEEAIASVCSAQLVR
ncbi:MAG: conserved repeat protein [Planctomycetaceae bacterium]|nr:conserved repeat protein [Planctomycetaceae bacterium]